MLQLHGCTCKYAIVQLSSFDKHHQVSKLSGQRELVDLYVKQGRPDRQTNLSSDALNKQSQHVFFKEMIASSQPLSWSCTLRVLECQLTVYLRSVDVCTCIKIIMTFLLLEVCININMFLSIRRKGSTI